MEKLTDIVSWVMLGEDNIVKLKKADKTYDLSSAVVEFVKKNNLGEKEDFSVELEVDTDKGENGTVTKLKEVGSSKKEEKTPTDKPDVSSETNKDRVTKELTVHGVSVDKKGVIFKEEEKVWYTLSDDINAQDFKDKYTGKTIEVYIEPSDEGNDVITGFTAKEEEKKDTDEPQEKKKYNNTGNSIEAQASLKCAKVIVANMVDKESKPDFVLRLITTISKHAYQTIQDLKNKE